MPPSNPTEPEHELWEGDLGEGVLGAYGDLGAMDGYSGANSPIFAPPQAFSMPDEADLGDLAAFELSRTPQSASELKLDEQNDSKLTKEMMSMDLGDITQFAFEHGSSESNPWSSNLHKTSDMAETEPLESAEPVMQDPSASSSSSGVSNNNDFYQTVMSSSTASVATNTSTRLDETAVPDQNEETNTFYANEEHSQLSVAESVKSVKSMAQSTKSVESVPSNTSKPIEHVHFTNEKLASASTDRPESLPPYTETAEIGETAITEEKPTHKRGPSQFEYFQAPTGSIEKIKVLDGESSDEESEWQPMTTVGSYEVYDDKNNVVVELDHEDQEERNAAASGYTRVAEDDAVSVTSLDAETDFLFDAHAPEDEVDTEFQLNSTKQMLSAQQRIAYAGLCRLAIAEMADLVHCLGKRGVAALDALRVWGSRVGLKLYTHLELNNDEQLMIESLVEHRVLAEDLTPCLKVVQHSTGEIFEAVDASSANVNELHEECRKVTTNLDVDVRWTVMCDLFLILLDGASYDARSRCLLVLIAAKLGISELDVCKFERKVTDVLELDESADQDWTENEIIARRKKKSRNRKLAYVGLATIGGGLVIGLSAGLLAPVVGAGFASVLTTIGITGTSGFLAGAGGTAIITTAGTAIGAQVGGKAMLRRAGHVKTFEFRPIFNNNRVNVVITVSGWLTGKDDDVRLPFSTIDPVVGDVLTVSWEPEMMRSLGQTINILATEALSMGVQQLLAATIMTTLMGALQAPMWLSKLSYLVDNPWSVSLDRAWAAGLILADTLMKRNLGSRPATLVGYSLGARVIYSCLAELARHKAYGLVQEVFLFGTPVFYNKKQFTNVRSVVAGRFVNGYSRKDWILAFLFPASKRYGSVIGLDPVPGVENVDLSENVDGHMAYRNMMPKLLAICGWPVTSEEFDEIEDPDPDRLREKQRTLLEELETNADEKPKKRMFWNLDWTQRAKSKAKPKENSDPEELFDIDAIRSEIGALQPELVFDDADTEKGSEKDAEKDAEKSTSNELKEANEVNDLVHDSMDVPAQEHLASKPLTLPEFDEIEEPASTLDYDDADWRLRGLGKSRL